MALVSPTKMSDDASIRQAISKLASYKLGPTSAPKYANISLTDPTANSLLYPDSDGLLTSLGAATNGQLPVGNTGNPPTLATLTGTANQITVTNGAGSITLSVPATLYVATSIDLGHASDTTITRSAAGTIAVEGVDVAMVGAAPTAHTHDGDTLQLDGVNSNGGAFAFNTTGTVTFNQTIAGNLTGNVTGDCSGNAGTVTNATFTTALTVNTGTLTLTANVANNSVLTIGAGAVSVSGSNTGDQTSLSGISDTKANFDTACSDGNFIFVGDAPTSHASSHAVSGADTVFPADPGADRYLMWDDDPGALVWAEVAAAGANTALSNLASVAINTTLVSDTDNTDALGTAAIGWSDIFLGNGSVITWSTAPSTADVTLTHSANTLTFAGGTVALGTATATGGLTGNVTGDCSGNAGTVTNATFTTALTVNTGTLTLTAAGSNDSVLTIGAGAVSVSGANTGDQTSLSGISDTKANFDTACSDGNFLYVGDAPTAHTASHAVGGADTVFPADPGADKYLMWDDDPGELVWADSGVAAHAVLDGSVHTDTVAQTVTRGSLIYGNSTPKWDELVIGTGFLRGDGTDCAWLSYANTLAALSGVAGATFNFNSQDVSGIASLSVVDAAIVQTSTSGYALSVTRDLAAANTDSALVYFLDDNAGDDQPILLIDQDGAGQCINIDSEDTANYAVSGNISAGACQFYLGSVANNAYHFKRNMETNAFPVCLITQDHAGNNGVALQVVQDGSGNAITATGTVSATAFSGPLTGNVTGDCTGNAGTATTAGSCSGNSATATALETSRTIGGTSFDGTANITVASATGGFAVTGGNLTLDTNDILVNTNKFTVDGATGNTLVAGTFESTGVATLGDASTLKTNAAPTADAEIANKKYVDDEVSAAGYVDRGNTSVSDFDEGDTPTEDAWTDLDLGPGGLGIVPANAKCVHLFFRVKDGSTHKRLIVRKNGSTSDQPGNVVGVLTQVANIVHYGNGTVGCDANGVIEYYLSADMDEFDITVTGWEI